MSLDKQSATVFLKTIFREVRERLTPQEYKELIHDILEEDEN